MSKRVFFTVTLMLLQSTAFAGTHQIGACHDSGIYITTPLGALAKYKCNLGSGSVTQWTLNKSTILLSAHNEDLGLVYGNAENTLVVVDGPSNVDTGCYSSLVLFDFTKEQPRVTAFGVKNACTEFHWASWGKKRSVIAIKRNVKFVYVNGKLLPPKKDDALFMNIQPTLFETPVDKLEPFVESLPVE